MPVIITIAPALAAASWPVLTALVGAAAQALGYRLLQEEADVEAGVPASLARVVELTLEHSQILEEALARGRSFILEKEDLRLTFRRGVRGEVTVSAESDSLSQADLQAEGQQFLNRVVQQYAYNKLMTELKSEGYAMAEEQVGEEGRIYLRVRRLA